MTPDGPSLGSKIIHDWSLFLFVGNGSADCCVFEYDISLQYSLNPIFTWTHWLRSELSKLCTNILTYCSVGLQCRSCVGLWRLSSYQPLSSVPNINAFVSHPRDYRGGIHMLWVFHCCWSKIWLMISSPTKWLCQSLHHCQHQLENRFFFGIAICMKATFNHFWNLISKCSLLRTYSAVWCN